MYKVRCTGNDDDSYTLSYGKGSKKLTVTLGRNESGWFYGTTNTPRYFSLKREAIVSWGEWVAKEYSSPDDPGERYDHDTFADNAAPTPVVANDEVANPVPQLRHFFSIADNDQIQKTIDNAPTRDDQIRQWFLAYVVKGKEFNLPLTTPVV